MITQFVAQASKSMSNSQTMRAAWVRGSPCSNVAPAHSSGCLGDMSIAAETMHTIHLLAYKYDGDGLKACEVLSEILFMLAQAHLLELHGLPPFTPPFTKTSAGDSDLIVDSDCTWLHTPPVQDWGARLDAASPVVASEQDRRLGVCMVPM